MIWYERLGRGTWQLPATDSEPLELEAHELAIILRGIDLVKLREDCQDVLHQLQLLRRWAFGARHERVFGDPRQKHLFDLDSILPLGTAALNPEASSRSESGTEQEAAEKRAAARKKKHALPAARKSESSVKTSVACSNSCPLSCTFTIITGRSMAATAGIAASRCLCCRTSG